MEEFKNKIIKGDCLEVMKTLEDNSIDLTVTSPPYDNLREYFLDKLVVWRYDVSNERKQAIIKEMREKGIKPISTPK